MADLNPPTIVCIAPKRGSVTVGRTAGFTFRITDHGDSGLDSASIQVALGEDALVTDGEVVDATDWDASQVILWGEGSSSIVEILLKRNELHAYEEELSFVVSAADGNENLTEKTFTFTIMPSPVYDGTGEEGALSPLEASLITPFTSYHAEVFRKRVTYGLVPGALPGNALEKQAARRLIQLVFRYGQDPMLSRLWVGESSYPKTIVQDARSYEALSLIDGQFREAVSQALGQLGGRIDPALSEHVRALATSNAVAAALVFLLTLCKVRDLGGGL